MSASQTRSITLRRCNTALKELKAGARRWSLWVPGRIELLGKHTDYAGGRSVLCALERGFLARVAPRRDGVIRVHEDGERDVQLLRRAASGLGVLVDADREDLELRVRLVLLPVEGR